MPTLRQGAIVVMDDLGSHKGPAERTAEATWRCLGALLDRVTPTECRHYFANAGYTS